MTTIRERVARAAGVFGVPVTNGRSANGGVPSDAGERNGRRPWVREDAHPFSLTTLASVVTLGTMLAGVAASRRMRSPSRAARPAAPLAPLTHVPTANGHPPEAASPEGLAEVATLETASAAPTRPPSWVPGPMTPTPSSPPTNGRSAAAASRANEPATDDEAPSATEAVEAAVSTEVTTEPTAIIAEAAAVAEEYAPDAPAGDALAQAPAAAAPTAAVPPRKGRFTTAFASLRDHDFRYLFFSTVLSGYGQWAQTIGMGWLVYTLTDRSAVQLAAVSAAGGLVRLLAGPFIGTALDHYPRRRILVWSTLAGALQGALLAVLVVTGNALVWHVYVFTVIEGLLTITNQGARQAYVYDITTDETLPNAVALSSIAQNVSRISGPPLAGVLIGFFGRSSPFVFLAIMLVLAAALTLPISLATRQAARVHVHPLRGPWEGLKYIANDRAMLGLTILAIVPALLVYPYVQLLPIFAEDVLGGGSTAYGLLAAAIGWGSFVGLIGLAFVGDIRRKGAVAMWGMLAYAIALIAFSQSTALVLSLVLLTTAGLFHGVALTLQQTLIQVLARNDMRGRATVVFQMGFALMPLGVLPMGLAIEQWGAAPAVGSFFAVSAVIFAAMLLFWKSLRAA